MDDSHVSGVVDDSEVCGFEESDNSERRDRLSELPDSIIHSILCLLHMKDVVGTTFLSKRWYNLWVTIPCLYFFCCTSRSRDFVNGAIAVWKGTKILKFKLVFDFDSSYTSDIDSWLLFAIDKQVEELHLCLCLCDEYYPPPLLYSCSSVKKLTIVGFSLNIGKNVQWNQLESLTIDGNKPLSENAVEDILHNAPRLEELDLWISGSRFNIQSSNLKKLRIDMYPDYKADESELRISAPNLESLEMLGAPWRRFLLSAPSLTKAILGFSYSSADVFQTLNHVEDITLRRCCIKELLELKKKDILVSFPNVKYLTLYPAAADEILGAVVMFPELMVLAVEYDGVFNNCMSVPCNPDELSILNIDSLEALHLRKVKIIWFLPDSSIYEVIQVILKNAKVLEKMVFRPEIYNQEMWCMVQEKLLSMPVASPTAQVIVKDLPEEYHTY